MVKFNPTVEIHQYILPKKVNKNLKYKRNLKRNRLLDDIECFMRYKNLIDSEQIIEIYKKAPKCKYHTIHPRFAQCGYKFYSLMS